MKFLRLVARKDGFWRAGVQHSGTPVYYPMAKMNPDEVMAYAKEIQKAGGTLTVFFRDRQGQERGQFSPAEIAELRAEPMLIVDEMDVNLEMAGSPEKTDAPPKKPAA
jgi:hypothetical protein